MHKFTTFLTQRQRQSTMQHYHLRSFIPFVNEFELWARTGCFGDFL